MVCDDPNDSDKSGKADDSEDNDEIRVRQKVIFAPKRQLTLKMENCFQYTNHVMSVNLISRTQF